jgi:hypothetical protein
MKKILSLMFCLALGGLVFTSCDKDEEEDPIVEPTKKMVTLGAQDNATLPGFYSVDQNKTYTMELASQNQDKIDIFCFYEAASGNNIALASPGSNITGIFTGPYSVETWTVKNTTKFCKTTLTAAQFDALLETDQLIVSSYDSLNSFRKAKNLVINDVYAFKTTSLKQGILKVTSVTQDTIGSVTFEVKIKQ